MRQSKAVSFEWDEQAKIECCCAAFDGEMGNNCVFPQFHYVGHHEKIEITFIHSCVHSHVPSMLSGALCFHLYLTSIHRQSITITVLYNSNVVLSAGWHPAQGDLR